MPQELLAGDVDAGLRAQRELRKAAERGADVTRDGAARRGVVVGSLGDVIEQLVDGFEYDLRRWVASPPREQHEGREHGTEVRRPCPVDLPRSPHRGRARRMPVERSIGGGCWARAWPRAQTAVSR